MLLLGVLDINTFQKGLIKLARRICCYNDTESREFNSLSEASEKLDICIFSISVALKTRKEYRGYFFEYLDDDDNQIIRYLRHKSDFRVHVTDLEHLKDFIDPGEISIPKEDNLLLPTDHIPGECWYQIKQYPQSYISNYSRVKLDIGNGMFRLIEQTPLLIDDQYYMTAFLSDGIKKTRCRIDRVMYATFYDPKFPIYQWNPEYDILHLDGNTLNSDRDNLKKVLNI